VLNGRPERLRCAPSGSAFDRSAASVGSNRQKRTKALYAEGRAQASDFLSQVCPRRAAYVDVTLRTELRVEASAWKSCVSARSCATAGAGLVLGGGQRSAAESARRCGAAIELDLRVAARESGGPASSRVVVAAERGQVPAIAVAGSLVVEVVDRGLQPSRSTCCAAAGCAERGPP
jgi:hypothetical protein